MVAAAEDREELGLGLLPVEEDLLPGESGDHVATSLEAQITGPVPVVLLGIVVIGGAVALDDPALSHEQIHPPDPGDLHLGPDRHTAQLEVEAQEPGIDFKAVFELPVFSITDPAFIERRAMSTAA